MSLSSWHRAHVQLVQKYFVTSGNVTTLLKLIKT